LIQLQIIFASGKSVTIARATVGKTVDTVEDIMVRHPARIKNIHVIAPGLLAAEGARIRHYLKLVDLDVRLNHIFDRDGLETFDLYEIAKHPRRVP
jgi:hypothetical protein